MFCVYRDAVPLMKNVGPIGVGFAKLSTPFWMKKETNNVASW